MIEWLRKASLFKDFTDHDLSCISEACQVMTYQAGTRIFNENELGTDFFIVISGSVKIYTTNLSNDAEKILAVFGEGESFGELSLLDGKPRSASAQAIEDTKVLSLTELKFSNLLRDNFDMSTIIVKELCNRLRETNQQVHDLTFLGAKERVIKNLVQLANKHGKRNGSIITIQLKLNYQEIAEIVGVPRNLLFQVFSDLQNNQVLHLTDNQISINLSNLKRR